MLRFTRGIRLLTIFSSAFAFAGLLSGCEDPHSYEGTIKTSPKARENITKIGQQTGDAPSETPPSPYGAKGKLLKGAPAK